MWTKICGVRDADTALRIAALKPSAIGLNFYEASQRYVAPSEARRIALAAAGAVPLIGVFVNADVAQMAEHARTLNLFGIQLHGDEPPEHIVELQARRPELRILRAFRVGAGGLAGVAEYLQACHQCGARVWAVLLDAHAAGHYGGSGQVAPWATIRAEYQTEQWPPLVLAGGLSCENIAAAIDEVQPWGVDVASGVESAPGVKDLARVAHFLETVRKSTS